MTINWRIEITGIDWLQPLIAQLNLKLDKIMETQAQFDAALAAFATQLNDFSTDLGTQTALINSTAQSIIDKIAAGGSPADLTAEAQTLANAASALTAAKTSLDSIAAGLPTTPTPPPGP